MKRFLDEDFLLDSKTAVDLYQGFARRQPIIDYHCHLSPHQIADDHRWRSLTEIWLDGDHYKWRAMRAAGIPERLITGDASDAEKFAAWASVVPQTLRNPLYHWTHLELAFPFGVRGKLLGPDTAAEIFEHCNQKLAEREFTAQGMLKQFGVRVVCSTDDPVDDLEPHRRHAANTAAATKLLPTWRPDKALALHDPAGWNKWIDKLAAAADIDIPDLARFRDAIAERHAFFHERGCRASDHGLERIYAAPYTDAEAAAAFAAARAGKPLSPEQIEKLRSALLLRLRGDGSPARLGAAVPPRRHAQHQHARDALPRPGHRLRRGRRLPAGRGAGAVPRSPGRRGPPGQDHRLQPEPARQRAADDDHRFVPGRLGAGQDAVRQRVVVPGSARRHGEADERAVEHGPAVALRRHVDRFAQLPVVLAARLLPPLAVQPARQRRRGGAAARPSARCWASWSKTSASETPAPTSASTSSAGRYRGARPCGVICTGWPTANGG